MYRHILLFTLLITFFNSSILAEDQPRAYQSGEHLKYVIHYGLIRGGRASLSVKTEKLKDQEVFHMVLTGRTVGLPNAIYRVKDTYESYVDPETSLPIKAIRNIREGRYRKYNELEFDHQNNTVKSKLSGVHEVPDNIQDILSAFYFARQNLFTPSLKKGDIVVVQTYFADELFPLRIRFMGYETIRSRMGKIKCFKFVPVVITGRAFKNEDDMTIWISADQNKLPIRVKFNLFIGSVKCDLVDYSGLANPLGSILKEAKE
ncbi:MAG: DUF3108 domain-containing protein [Marinifilaceae bacterium]